MTRFALMLASTSFRCAALAREARYRPSNIEDVALAAEMIVIGRVTGIEEREPAPA